MTSCKFSVNAIQTELFHPLQDLGDFIRRGLGHHPLHDGMIVAVTSKIVSLAEGRLVCQDSIDKTTLVKQESDIYLGDIGYGCHLTIKHGLLIPSAGIDESNSEQGNYILYPKDPFGSARKIHDELTCFFGLKKLGVLLTDSHTTPLRRGVTGVALAYWGLRGTRNFIGHPDLFGRQLKMTQVNVVDALACSAVFAMGESNERRPLALIEGADVEFTDQTSPTEIQIPLEEDLYAPMLRSTIQ